MDDTKAKAAYEAHMGEQRETFQQAGLESRNKIVQRVLNPEGLDLSFESLDERKKWIWRYVAEGDSLQEARRKAYQRQVQ